MMNIKIASIATLLVLNGCAVSQAPRQSEIRFLDYNSRDAIEIRDTCQSLGTISGYSTWGGTAYQNLGVANAQTGALKGAPEIAAVATHIVWRQTGHLGVLMEGHAYNCNVVS